MACVAATSWPVSARAGHGRLATKPEAPPASAFTAATQYLGVGEGARDLRRGADSCQGALGARGELRSEGLEVARQGRGEDDEVRVPRVDCPGQLLDRGAHPEIVDPPSAAVQDDAEDHQRQVAKLPRGAGQDGAGAVPVPPAPGQPGEPPADDVAGEVLLGDAGRSPLPVLPELGEIGTTTSRSTGVREKSDTSRSRTACAVGSSKASRAPPVDTGQLTRRRWDAVRPGGPAVAGPACLSEHRSRRLGVRQAAGEVSLHPADLQRVRLGVQPEAGPLCAPDGGGRSGPLTPAGRGPSRRGAGSAHRCAAAASLRESRCKHSTILRQTFDKVARRSYRHI